MRKKELNGSVRNNKIYRRFIRSLERSGLRSHDVVAELRKHSLSLDCDSFSNEERVAVVYRFSINDKHI